METRQLVEVSFGSEFWMISSRCIVMAAQSHKTLNFLGIFAFFNKTDPLQ